MPQAHLLPEATLSMGGRPEGTSVAWPTPQQRTLREAVTTQASLSKSCMWITSTTSEGTEPPLSALPQQRTRRVCSTAQLAYCPMAV